MKTAKLMIKLALVIAVAAFCSGYFGKSYQQNTAEYVVREGDTLWYVAGQYFGKEERTDHFGEFQCRKFASATGLLCIERPSARLFPVRKMHIR